MRTMPHSHKEISFFLLASCIPIIIFSQNLQECPSWHSLNDGARQESSASSLTYLSFLDVMVMGSFEASSFPKAAQNHFEMSFVNEKRRLSFGDGSANARNIPSDLLFVEDVKSGSFSRFNPIGGVAFDDSNELFNIIKFQLAEITVDYSAPSKTKGGNTKSFALQTWNLVFFAQEDLEENPDNFNIFGFKNVDISSKITSRLKANTDPQDISICDLFWALYLEADVSDLSEELQQTPSLSGLENLVVYSKNEESDGYPSYLHQNYIFWTTFAFQANSDASTFPNVFMLYGTELGSFVSLATANTLVIFFKSFSALDGEGEISCSTKGIDVSSCFFYEESGDTEAQVQYYSTSSSSITSTRTVYSELNQARVEIELINKGEDSWSIIFPFKGTSEDSSVYLTIGIRDSDYNLEYLSGSPNGNSFGPGVDNQVFYYNSGLDISDINATKYQVTSLYAGRTNDIPEASGWLEISKEYLAGETAGAVTLNAAQSFSSDEDSGGFSGVMLCTSYDFQGKNFKFSELSDSSNVQSRLHPNFYGCWDPFEFNEGVCFLCNIDGETASVTNPLKITLENFILPNDRLYFDFQSTTVAFNQMGDAESIVNLAMAGDLWSESELFLPQGSTFKRGVPSEKLILKFSTENGLPSGANLILDVISDYGGANEIIVESPTSSDSVEPICYIEDFEGSIQSCSFTWEEFTISIEISEDISPGKFSVHFYGLFASSDTDLKSNKSFFKFSGEVLNSEGETIAFSRSDSTQTVNYISSSCSLTLSSLYLSFSNSDSLTELNFYVTTTKNIYEGDYFEISFEDFDNNENDSECNIWTSDWVHSTTFASCGFESFEKITLEPKIRTNGVLSDLGFWVTLNNIDTSSSFDSAKITVKLLYNEGVTIKETTSSLPLPTRTANEIEITSLILPKDYVGTASTIRISFKTPLELQKSFSLYILFSSSYGYTLSNQRVIVEINEAKAFVEEDDYRVLRVLGLPESIPVETEVEVVIRGVITPNVGSDGFRTISIGILSNSEVSLELLTTLSASFTAFGSKIYKTSPTKLSDMGLIYPRIKEVADPTARGDSRISFEFEPPTAFDSGIEFWVWLKAIDLALERVEDIKCKLITENEEDISEDCELLGSVVRFWTTSSIYPDETYTLRLSNVPNPDWAGCQSEFLSVEIYDGNDLLALSASPLDDSNQITILEPDYSLEVSGVENRFSTLEIPIGFYSEIVLEANTGIFYDKIQFSLTESTGYIKTAVIPHFGWNGYSQIGYSSASLTVYVEESTHVLTNLLYIEKDSDEIANAPVVLYRLLFQTSSISVNDGKTIQVESGRTSLPIMVCLDDIPVSPQTFKLEISADVASNPNLELSHSKITLNRFQICTQITVDANSPRAKAGMEATLKITPQSTLFGSYSGLIQVISQVSKTLAMEASSESIKSTSATIFVDPNSLMSLVEVYVAPSVHNLFANGMDNSKALELIAENRYISPESVVSYTVSSGSFVKIALTDLLINVKYDYEVVVIGADNQEISYSGTFKTEAEVSGNEKGVYYTLYFSEYVRYTQRMALMCDIPSVLGIRLEDISTLEGDTCYEAIDFSSDGFYVKGSYSSSTSDEECFEDCKINENLRMVQESFSSSSSSSDNGENFSFDFVIWPRLSLSSPDYTHDPQSSKAIFSLLSEFFDDSYPLLKASGPFYVEIITPSSVSAGAASVSASQAIISNLFLLDENQKKVNGFICYAVFKELVDAVISEIKKGKKDDKEALMYDCGVANSDEPFKIVFSEASELTKYSFNYFGKSADSRQYARTTGVTTQYLVTSSEEETIGAERLCFLWNLMGLSFFLIISFTI